MAHQNGAAEVDNFDQDVLAAEPFDHAVQAASRAQRSEITTLNRGVPDDQARGPGESHILGHGFDKTGVRDQALQTMPALIPVQHPVGLDQHACAAGDEGAERIPSGAPQARAIQAPIEQ